MAPNLAWASKITSIKANGKWHYLCIVMNLFSRKVISWHICDNANAVLVITAFPKAYDKRPPYGLIFHSDQGTPYTSYAFRQLLDSLHVVQSFSKKGYPFVNACCECFFKYLKKEQTNRKCYSSLKELQLSILEYMEGYYNSKRPHITLGMLTPSEAEALYWEQNASFSLG